MKEEIKEKYIVVKKEERRKAKERKIGKHVGNDAYVNQMSILKNKNKETTKRTIKSITESIIKKSKKQEYSEQLKPLKIDTQRIVINQYHAPQGQPHTRTPASKSTPSHKKKQINREYKNRERIEREQKMRDEEDDDEEEEEEIREGRILNFDDEDEEEYMATPTRYEENHEQHQQEYNYHHQNQPVSLPGMRVHTERRQELLRPPQREEVLQQLAITPPVVETSPVYVPGTDMETPQRDQEQDEHVSQEPMMEQLQHELRQTQRELTELRQQLRRRSSTNHFGPSPQAVSSPSEELRNPEDSETRRLEFFPYDYKLALHTISKFVMNSMGPDSPIMTPSGYIAGSESNSYYNVSKHLKQVEPHMVLFDIGEMLRVQNQIMEAVKYFQQSLELKETASANYRLGSIYFDIQAHDKALIYLQKAANMGNGDAMTNIGCVHFARQDYEKAMEYYIKGAEMGCYFANINIGKCYISGFGVPVDYQKAYHYLKVAINMGSRNSAQNYLSRLESKILREQTSEAYL